MLRMFTPVPLTPLVGHYYKGFENRFEVSSYVDSIENSPKRVECHTEGNRYKRPKDACRYFGKNISWAVFGDSHVVEPGYALARRLETSGDGLLHLSFSDCPPALLFEVKLPGCTRWINESLGYLENNKVIKNVLIGYRYSFYLFGNHIDSYPQLPDVDPRWQFTDPLRKSLSGDSREIYWKSLEEIIVRLLRSGKIVHLLYPIPELPLNIDKAIMPLSVFGGSTVLDLEKATSARYYFDRHEFIISKLDSLPYGSNLHAIKPFELICNEKYCPAVKDKKSLYFDDDHLSISGAELMINGISLGN